MKANRKELALLRGKRDPASLQLWTQSFAGGDPDRSRRYGLAVATFLGQPPPDGHEGGWNDYIGHFSPNTRKAYAYAVTEFFEWAAAQHGRIVPPDQVTRLDAENYVNWLANRPFSLAEEKLKDGDREELLELYQIVEELGSATIQDIVNGLSEGLRKKFFGEHGEDRIENRKRLSTQVRKLVTMDILDSTPTMSELREQYSQAGITRWEVPNSSGKSVPIEEVFTYSKKEYAGTSRTTIAQRVSALNSFWHVLMQGENVKGGEPLLQHNVWEVVRKRVNRGLTSEKKQASRAQKMPSQDVIQMLRDAPSRTLVQLRNKAILYLMVFAGVRTSELLMLRRGKPDRGSWKAWFDGSEPPALQLVRKGNKSMRLPYPPAALKPLIEFQRELERHSAPSFAQYSDARGDHYVPRESSAWYYRDLQLPDAPLFPPISFWGNSLTYRSDYRKPLSRVQCYRLLKQIAKESGLATEAVEHVHPHAIRHFAANAMVIGGKDIREVQAILGHSSMMTTETYLEDPEGDVKLSGQEAVLTYLDTQGVAVAPMYKDKPSAVVVDTVGTDTDVEVPEVEVSAAEVKVLNVLEPEQIPDHELPAAPLQYDPEVVAMAMPEGKPPILDTTEGLVGVEGTTNSETLLEDLSQTVRAGQSPGSPSWVYEAMSDPKATHETVIFNRGGEKDIDWLNEHYPRMPKNFGVGHESYLLWYVKARGNISRGGYFKGLPPFPVFSSEQCNPETSTGEMFLERIEEAYSRLVHGNPEQGILPSPMRSVGMVRWYSFFVYHGTKYEEEMNQNVLEARTQWQPWDSVVSLRDVRSHDDIWLVQWLVDNAHTYRASIDAMKRGVSRTEEDVTASFLKSSFEGVELITEVPEWMIYDDPVLHLYEVDRSQWKEMINWLKNVTGQQLEVSRKLEREEQEQTAVEEQKTKARTVRDVLTSVVYLVDQLSRAKHTARERVAELRGQLRTQLYWYATAAGGVTRLRTSLEALKGMGTREFNQAMSVEYQRLGVPDPNAPEYRSQKGKQRVAAIVAALYPDLPELNAGNVFADSRLFNPKWFRIDEDARTVFIEKGERERIQRQFGQDPELLVRRAVRAMWESRDKGYEALWGVMMSYFSWIIPSGKEMESKVLGIPVADLGTEELNVQARKNWLKAWTEQMKRIATGQAVEKPDALVFEAERVDLEPWERFLKEEESKSGEDALDRIAGDGVDFAMSTSISGGYAESPEDIAMGLEELGYDEDYLRNRSVRKLRRNGRETFVMLEGEKPAQWYNVDLFGRKKGHLRPNAPPTLISPGVVYRSQKRLFPARQLLPSPFRMVSGMDLSDE